MAHLLVFPSEAGKPRTYPVAGEPVSIGRHPKNTVVLNDECVSVYHAEITLKDGKPQVRDLGSSNGIKVNRKRVREATLSEGDEIRFGPIICHLRGEKWTETAAKPVPAAKSEKPKSSADKRASPEKSPAADTKAPAEKKDPATNKDAASKTTDSKAASSTATETKEPEPAAPEAPPVPFLERLRETFADSRYFALSLVIHIAIVLLAGSIVLFKVAIDPPDFVADGDGLVAGANEISVPDAIVDNVPGIAPQIPNVNAPKVDVITTSASASNFKIAPPQLDMKLNPIAANAAKIAANAARGASAIYANVPGTMGGRFGAGRARAMAINQMKPKSEQAVIRGLEWLVANQNEDGSWGEEFKGAMTGFALLCFLGHGELQDSPKFGRSVGRALEWVYANGMKNDGRLSMEKEFTQTGVYEHAICTYALGEYYTMTQDRRVIALFSRAIRHIVNGQGPTGGWIYSYDESADDLSVSGWQIQALKAAHLTQLNLPGVDKALDNAARYLERVKGPKGGYGYRGPADDYSLTGVGILCQLFWKGDRATVQKGMQWLLDETERSRPVKYAGDRADLYAWYYHTQACLMFGGDAWKLWNGWFQDEICDAQNPDGSWPAPGGVNVGPQAQNNLTGAVYRTSLCILMLEVFYRYMPTNRG